MARCRRPRPQNSWQSMPPGGCGWATTCRPCGSSTASGSGRSIASPCCWNGSGSAACCAAMNRRSHGTQIAPNWARRPIRSSRWNFSIVSAAPTRISPPCSYSGSCPGSNAQWLSGQCCPWRCAVLRCRSPNAFTSFATPRVKRRSWIFLSVSPATRLARAPCAA